MVGTQVTNTGSLDAHGGSADEMTGSGSVGGNVYVMSLKAPTSNMVDAPGGISVKGGAASIPGQHGSVMIDGQLATSAWTH